jgi:hypothetical protein
MNHEDYLKVPPPILEVLLAFELLNNHYHKRINSHIFKMRDDCYKILHKKYITYVNVKALFHI